MPVSRAVPPYLQSPWHPPPTQSTSHTHLTPHPTLTPHLTSHTVLTPTQRLIHVPVERCRTVKRAITLWREAEEGEGEAGEGEGEGGMGEGSAPRARATEEWKEAGEVVVDIDPRSPSPSPEPLPPLSLSSLTLPLTSPPLLPPTLPPPHHPTSLPHRLRQYNPRVVLGYAQRMRPGSRRLVAVPAESLPPPPFRPPSYPLSTVPPPIEPASVFPPLPLSSSSPPPYPSSSLSSSSIFAPPLLSITAPTSDPFPLPFPPSSSSSASFPDSLGLVHDPTTLLSSGLVLRDHSEVPRGSPRSMLQGTWVAQVQRGGRGERAGLREGDEVVRVHGREVRSAEEVVGVVNMIPGRLEVQVRRDGQLIALTL